MRSCNIKMRDSVWGRNTPKQAKGYQINTRHCNSVNYHVSLILMAFTVLHQQPFNTSHCPSPYYLNYEFVRFLLSSQSLLANKMLTKSAKFVQHMTIYTLARVMLPLPVLMAVHLLMSLHFLVTVHFLMSLRLLMKVHRSV